MSTPQTLDEIPDSPGWIYARALRAAADTLITEIGEGPSFLLSNLRYSLGVVVGTPDRQLLQQALNAQSGPVRLLTTLEDSAVVASALPDWRSMTAIVHTLGADGLLVADARHSVDILPLHEVLGQPGWPSDVAEELARGDHNALAAVAFVDSHPASVCYVAFETEAFWDVSIETLEPHRRRGLAESCAVRLIQEMHRRGKMPVWGAEVQNVPSLRLAWKLGFVPAERLALFTRA